MDINNFNLRENADIVALAMDCAKSLDSTELKKWFKQKSEKIEKCWFCQTENPNVGTKETQYTDFDGYYDKCTIIYCQNCKNTIKIEV